jgi:hypothetical protein
MTHSPVAAEFLIIWDILLTLGDEVSYSPHFQVEETPDVISDQAHMAGPLDYGKVSLFFCELGEVIPTSPTSDHHPPEPLLSSYPFCL